MIELKDIAFSYRDSGALQNINVIIQKGEAVAVIGPNGSGKSTFLKLLNAIVYKDRGQYIFNGSDINEKAMENSIFSKQFHKRMGFVFQNTESQLFCSSVYDEIAFGPYQMGFSEVEIEARVSDCMKPLDIEMLSKRHPVHLSGGEKKKVAIASVLSTNPDILVLDEPMNGLDPRTKRFLRELMVKLNSCGKTVICATHDFEYVKDVFKRVLVFSKDHRIVRDDDYDSVINDRDFLYENNII
jgi:cobalt/nickel transport system ATP-binding protein